MAAPRPVRGVWLAILVPVAASWCSPAECASLPPDLRFRTISNERVSVHFHQGLESMAREAASLSAEILPDLEERLGARVGRVQIVLADTTDDPAGFATPFPYPLVHVRAVAPDGADDFGNHDGWLRLVLTHELTHVVHLEMARGVLGAGRKVLGRAPYLFPNSFTPGWLLEGLATYEETEGTAFGRGRNPDVRMLLRSAAIGGDFPAEDQAALALDRWPGGQSAYLFGEAFLRSLAEQLDPDVLRRLAHAQSGRLIPFTDDLTAYQVTGGSFHTRWQEWEDWSRSRFGAGARRIAGEGLTRSRPVTTCGVRQTGPRFSPDGEWIAYTSRTLTRYGSVRLVRRDGTGDRRLAYRNGGTAVSWTPDGGELIYDEIEFHRLFSTFSDLRVVDVRTGRVRKLTRGSRARDPDVSPDGRDVVFVRQGSEGSELALLGLEPGSSPRTLVTASRGVEWSRPRFAPGGGTVVASRLGPGGWLDLVEVDAGTGSMRDLTHDRAKDVEPSFTPDGKWVVFRSDRDGVSNLYAVGRRDGRLLRVTRVLGGAFTPDVSPDGRSVAFSDYGVRGYDVRIAQLELDALPPAPAFRDPYPASRPSPVAEELEDRPYHAGATLLPRFWSPYATGLFSGEATFGVVTGSVDPLFRHAYGLDLHHTSNAGRLGFRGYYQYDRFRPTLTVSLRDTSDPQEGGVLREREAVLGASLPLARSFRSSRALSLAWRRKREVRDDPDGRLSLDLGGLEAAFSLAASRQYPYSVSPVEGERVRLAIIREAPAFGSEVSLTKATADLRLYRRLVGEDDALALRLGGGATWGSPRFRDSFAAGGFPDGSLFDLVGTNVSVLRGYPPSVFRGRNVVYGNAEYRLPLAHPQRGYRSFGVFLRHVHASLFVDAANPWSGAFRTGDLRVGAGFALGGDFVIGHHVPLTVVAGLARGLSTLGETQVYFRTGLAF
jgi:Tol biopolymer transport system component